MKVTTFSINTTDDRPREKGKTMTERTWETWKDNGNGLYGFGFEDGECVYAGRYEGCPDELVPARRAFCKSGLEEFVNLDGSDTEWTGEDAAKVYDLVTDTGSEVADKAADETADIIIDNWEGDYEYRDWCAVDSYDPVTERIERVMVGTVGDALHYMREYASQPAEVAFSRFYRCQVISAQSARRFFEHVRENPGEPYELMDESIESVSLNEAAAAMGVSRQRAHVLYREGRILGHKVRGKLRIDAASVQRYIENRADGGR